MHRRFDYTKGRWILKRREGFVSNSSSSSFVIIGKKVSALKADYENHKYTVVEWNDYCSDGQDVFELTDEHLVYWPYIEGTPMWLWEDSTIVYEDGTITLPGGEYEVESGEADYYSSQDMDRFLERYEIVPELVLEAVLNGKSVPQAVLDRLSPKMSRILKMFLEGKVTVEAVEVMLDED